ncbi:ribonuclease toxin immunity protein CdiI [Clostridium taeniosporum]|uniref:CDI immunity protein domain-containing protein n=1 Tax=Clostridium taeniosporum TaxID=394958 RepID=A0A1D7XJJ5_9CLOT|nr:ribonuclease toxin immunity protein CdiI [Clostridium taeniosporum]AOR23501.1 hypothetical protein BGI42_07005 [Clostridium taeniosporum]
MYEYKEFNEKMKKNYLDKGAVIDVLNAYANGSDFLQKLEKIKNKETERSQVLGIIYSQDFEEDDDGYFGESRVLFYAGDDCYDIIDYDDLYLYLYFACEFYIEKHENEKEIVQEKLALIAESYGIK